MDDLTEKLRSAFENSAVEILLGPEFLRQLRNDRFEHKDKESCVNAVIAFQRNPKSSSLKFERLAGERNANHYSIRGSQELRVILSLELEGGTRILFANMGHHDDMYRWSTRKGGRSDLNDERNHALVGKPESASEKEIRNTLQDALNGRFDYWRLFLPERMKNLATERVNGASRVRGAAGTGKSVLALHRARALGERYGGEKILFTTFSRSLARHMESLFKSLPRRPRNVEFRNVDQLVRIVLEGDFPLNEEEENAAFDEAFEESLDEGMKRRFTKEYLKAEIEYVVLGRNATREEYLDTGRFERLGRLKSLRRRDRELVWNLKESWDSRLASRRLTTWPKLRIEALERLGEKDTPAYRAAVIDEAQDLSLVSMKLIRGFVCGPENEDVKTDAITMYDDTAQRFYAGGFLPRWVPINVAGGNRSHTLAENYRNRPEILRAAETVRGETLLMKSDEDDGAVASPEPVLSSGQKPKFVKVSGSEPEFILKEIDRLVELDGLRFEDIAVLAHRNKDVDDMCGELQDAGVPHANLSSLREDSGHLNGVSVGTFDRSKGLEFRAVFIFRVGETAFFDERVRHKRDGFSESESEPLSDEEKEARKLLVDRLYVGMTRARDLLYLVADERPIDRIEEAINNNRIRDLTPARIVQEWED